MLSQGVRPQRLHRRALWEPVAGSRARGKLHAVWAPGNLLYGEEWEGAQGPLYSGYAPCPCCALCAVRCAGPPTSETNADLRSPGGRGQRCVKREEGRITGHAGPTAKPCCLGGRVRDMCLSGDLEDEWELAEVGGQGHVSEP